MRLHEYEGKQLLSAAGIEVPPAILAENGADAACAARTLGGPLVIKAQVLAGGRGRDGGVQSADDEQSAQHHATQILSRPCRGLTPASVLVEFRLSIEQELYAGMTIDPVAGRPVLLLGRGGVDVEDRARAGGGPLRLAIDPTIGVTLADAQQLTSRLGVEPAEPIAETLCRIWQVFSEEQALTVEINPLAVLADSRVVALDAVVELDDAARELAGLPLREEEGGPRRERDGGMSFIELGGDVGIICSGAGLGMATMDLIAEHAKPANFLETGGGISRDLMRRAMERVLACDGVRGVIINVYGGINPIHDGALGVADVMAAGLEIPVVAKALGNHQEETWEILEAAGVTVVRDVATECAVDVLMKQMRDSE
ncbi:MAG: succinyl-CoA synthetase subunit beta [Gemmatimonadetes bacterium]|nr:succinyl-CoA synthetase subunit beta [Gemmatimonadota bacterium]MBT6148236.1 succinyl-CoA synthetase subunit beta [Gemmatimonadota bacterium]MBT7860345.1 succinyl-CoA synthetase subunit beta [Gemmatimonadota bacterium]